MNTDVLPKTSYARVPRRMTATNSPGGGWDLNETYSLLTGVPGPYQGHENFKLSGGREGGAAQNVV